MPPAYVKPYVKRQKNDAAICEAVTRAKMRSVEKAHTIRKFAGVKSTLENRCVKKNRAIPMECWLIWRPTRKSAVVYASRFVLGDAASPRKTRIA